MSRGANRAHLGDRKYVSFVTVSFKNMSMNKLARSTVRGVFKKRTIAAKVNSPYNTAPQQPSTILVQSSFIVF